MSVQDGSNIGPALRRATVFSRNSASGFGRWRLGVGRGSTSCILGIDPFTTASLRDGGRVHGGYARGQVARCTGTSATRMRHERRSVLYASELLT